MDEIYTLIQHRNAIETTPFLSVHKSNAALLSLVDSLQEKCEALEKAYAEGSSNNNNNNSDNTSAAATAALRNETRLREKLETLSEECMEVRRKHADDTERALQVQKDLASMKDLNTAQASIIAKLKQEHEQVEIQVNVVSNELREAQSRTDLAEQQYMGLKDTIRTLQEENDGLTKENAKLVERVVSEKDQMAGQVDKLNKEVERLKKEVHMLRTLQKQEQKRNNKSWFQKMVGAEGNTSTAAEATASQKQSQRKFGTMGVVIPSKPKHVIQAHSGEATCTRYDSTGQDLVATSGNDATVKVWDTSTGSCKATLRGTSGHTIAACDLGGGLAVGGGSDKTCKVWNVKTERMIHHLVGHSNRITCVRLLHGEKAVLTGSADRSIKLWDISRNTYRQTTTLRYSSIANCIDVGPDGCTAVSGHQDGSLRFWDLKSGEQTANIPDLYQQGGVTSVSFHPTATEQLLTNGKDSIIKIVNVKTCKPLQTFTHDEFKSSLSYSSACFSPDGKYVAAGSSTSGLIFVWRVQDGRLVSKLEGHKAGVGAFCWSRGGTDGQQVASSDKQGNLILWA